MDHGPILRNTTLQDSVQASNFISLLFFLFFEKIAKNLLVI